jgi:CRISPR-associated endonuclease Cas1
MRPRCDPFDAAMIRDAIAKGETTERRAYEAYASTAARPYARSSFDVMLRLRNSPFENDRALRPCPFDQRKHSTASVTVPGSDRLHRAWRIAPVKPSNVLTLTGDSISLSIKRGALIATRDVTTLVYEPRAVKPNAIVLTGWGGVITLAALRFCAKHKIAVVILDWDRDFMTAMALPARRAARIARMQLEVLLPDRTLTVAKTLIAAKISAHMHLGAMHETKARTAIERAQAADTERALLMIEAQAARLAWVERPIVMRWREAGHIPSSWKLPFSQRRRLDRKFSRHATDPINALLNLALAVTIGRLVVALAAHGFNPAIGVLHKSPRWPLAYDAIELLRPHVEAAVFDFIDERAFAPDEFIRVNDGTVKTSSDLSVEFLDAVAHPQVDLDAAIFRLSRLLQA